MNEQERLTAERACERLSIAYARHVDYGQYDACAELFADDGLLNTGKPMKGRETIRRGMHRRSDTLRSRHVLTNIWVEVTDDDHAHGISYLTLYRHVGEESKNPRAIDLQGPAAVGHYQDEFIRTDQGWRIKSRALYFAFRRAEAFPGA